MNILDETLNYYANLMLDDFRKSEIHKKFYEEATNLNCKMKVDCGKSIDLKDENIYLGIVFCDENDEPIGDVESKVGKDFSEHFGDYEPDAVHIRNENLKVDYEICMDERSYHDIYHR